MTILSKSRLEWQRSIKANYDLKLNLITNSDDRYQFNKESNLKIYIIALMELPKLTVENNQKPTLPNETQEKLKKNDLLERILQFIVRHIMLEFNSHNYDGNSVIRQAHSIVEKYDGTDRKSTV